MFTPNSNLVLISRSPGRSAQRMVKRAHHRDCDKQIMRNSPEYQSAKWHTLRSVRRTTLSWLLAACLLSGCGDSPTLKTVATPSSTLASRSRLHQPITVEARGHNFKWGFFTTGPDKRPGTGDERSLGNELPVPPNAMVTLIVTSDDYIYTINAPDGQVAAAVPEMQHTLQFRAPSKGRHEFRTDPMCGLRYFHDDVLGTMIVTEDPRHPPVVSNGKNRNSP